MLNKSLVQCLRKGYCMKVRLDLELTCKSCMDNIYSLNEIVHEGGQT